MQQASLEKQKQAAHLLVCVKDIRKLHTKLGTIKLRAELREEIRKCGRGFGRDKFFDLLRHHNLLVKRRGKYAITTNSDHPFYKHKNWLKGISISSPDEAWVSDITYLRTQGGFVYLSLVTDVYSRKIVGWDVNMSLAVEGAVKAVKKAISQCSGTKNLIHHSDRGIQYCCHAYTGLLKKNGIKISMGEAGNCYDNAIAERVNGILKHEYLLDNEFADYEQAVEAAAQAIYLYNYERPHFSLGLKKPTEVYERPTAAVNVG
jgi:putative transposase